MEQNKKALLTEQANKIAEVVKVVCRGTASIYEW